MRSKTIPLADERCVAVTKASKRIVDAVRADLLKQIPDWQIQTRDGIERLERQFRFADFAQALAFTNRIGAIADAQDHHPAILTEWGRVTVGWWTHVVAGLHRNDFVMAAKTDSLYAVTMS
jgi:4a-hydroxytetrahydrobiopterin dehydratase